MKLKFKIDELLYISDMSLSDLATKIGMPKEMLIDWLDDKIEQDADTLKKISLVSGVSSDFFLGLDNNLKVYNFKLTKHQKSLIKK